MVSTFKGWGSSVNVGIVFMTTEMFTPLVQVQIYHENDVQFITKESIEQPPPKKSELFYENIRLQTPKAHPRW